MSTMMDERKKRYSKDDINDIIRDEHISSDDFTFLCALSTHATVMEHPHTGQGVLAGMRSVDVVVLESDKYPTGYFFETGQQPVIVINEESSILDYDFISDLHPMHDWDVYLWLTYPWTIAETPIGIHGEWYRREVYPDGIVAFDGVTLGWEDKNPTDKESNNDQSE